MKKFQLIVQSQLSRYPLSQIEDLYKLTHQASLGSEHAVKDPKSARDWLFRELKEMVNISTDPLVDEISPDGQIIRIHLKPFIESGGEPEILLKVIVQTANGYLGSIENLIQNWRSIERLAESSKINFQPEELRRYIILMDSLGYPAVHHSLQYENAYTPHYRVVAREYVDQIIPSLIQ